MNEMQDNELDDLFRKSMSNPDIPFDLDAWKAMEAKLNQQERRRTIYLRIVGGSVLGVILVIGSTWYFNKNSTINDSKTFNEITEITTKGKQYYTTSTGRSKVASENLKIQKGNIEGAAQINKKQYVQTEVKNYTDDLKQSSVTSYQRNKLSIVRRSELTKPQIKTKKVRYSTIVDSVHDSPSNTLEQGISEKNIQTDLHTNDYFLANDSSVNHRPITIDTSDLLVTYNNKINNNSNNVFSDRVLLSEDSTNKVIKDSSEILDSIKDESAIAKEKNDKNVVNQISIGLILNPEYSSSTRLDFDKPGFNIGLSLEYYLSSRISIVTGFIYTRKIYSCDGYDYTAPPSYSSWGNNYVPSTVNAICAVADIPINIRYKYLTEKTFNLYVSSGLSSYIMFKENYHFEYAVKTPSSIQNEQVVNKNRYLFNIYNVSIGIEKYINQRVSVQIEPFAKIPLAGIGEGKIKLVSTGVYFSLKYYLK